MKPPFTSTQIKRSLELANVYWDWILSVNKIVGEPSLDWNNSASQFDQVSRQHNVVVFIFDLARNKFVYVSDEVKTMTGYEPEHFTSDDGIHKSISYYHPDYRHATLLMSQVGLELTQSDPLGMCKNMLHYDFLYKRKDGSYFRLFQQTILFFNTNERNSLAYSVSFGHDITHLKKDPSANLIVTTPSTIKMLNYNFDKSVLEEIKPFSEQERNVLRLLSQGKDSKTIASELNISSHTADTHRRNLLKKTNCIDTTAMVTYCRIVGLL